VPQQSEILSGGMKLAVRGSAVSVADLRELARARLIEAGGGNVDLIDDSLELDHSDDARIQDTWVEVDVRAAASVVPTFDAEAVRGKIRGRTVEQALDWLANNLALQSPPRINIEPEGWPRLPVLSGRLDIVLSSLP
jgi:hypothetical protein